MEPAKEELLEALRAMESLLGKMRKVLPKLTPGTSQHTLALRRTRAIEISVGLIRKELEMWEGMDRQKGTRP